MDTEISCPYCGEVIDLSVDASGGDSQQYVEDCAVCCQPMEVTVTLDGEDCRVSVQRLDE